MNAIRFSSLNVRGLASKSSFFLSFLSDTSLGLSSPDILFLQETHLASPDSFLDSLLFGTH